ncbi:helix-turn-helix domain-containing protein [Bradyrhizobium sp. Pear76]|uniref:helix-turn-helix domain-containing protein n=1 Tax=Bradyrhizobium oropedii TaxID=1571201 RepID=UPI001E5132A5|nr:helix-turn-helix transcriptional regulator [Bradyrhizobium oropedii]MCC8967076.1 helix-turn-helix domain-containing protein [Bradyrhizobium oropedii]
MKKLVGLPYPVTEMLPRVGEAIRTARIRRRKTAADIAGRLGVSLPTLRKLETGDPGVSLGTFLAALWLLDLSPALMAALDPAKDEIGLTLEMARLPKRVRPAADVKLDQL